MVVCSIGVDPATRFPRGRAPIPKTCFGLRPGACCIAPPDPEFDALHPRKRVRFSGLGPLDIAVVYAADPPQTGCAGRSIATFAGGGNWDYDVPADSNRNITGACYVKLPEGEVKDVDKPWLEMEGALATFTENSQWISGRANTANANSMAAKWGFGSMAGKFPWDKPTSRVKRFGKRVVDLGRMNMGGSGLEKRTIRSATKGLIIFGPPRRISWADTVEVDGVRYTAETPQSQVFVSVDGKVLNYTEPAS
ncbi:MAG: hypothetical protein Q9220_000762 [cf. Caloplaca sp. 1 TL-2023]